MNKRFMHRFLLRRGFNVKTFSAYVRHAQEVRRERKQFLARSHAEFPFSADYRIFDDRDDEAGQAKGHYFHQDLLVARAIHKANPHRHIDVGSSIYGFVSHVASFRPIEVLDIRDVTSTIEGIHFRAADLMDLPSDLVGSTDSLSCLHVIEHFGLGRYRDPIDPDGWKKGIASLHRMLKPGGILYLSTPTGEHQRIEFNAHRVFALPFLRDHLASMFQIQWLAFVDDSGVLFNDIDPYSPDAEASFRADYGCSIWCLKKL